MPDNQDFNQDKLEREKLRVNKLMALVQSNDGMVSAEQIAEVWDIPVSTVFDELGKLMSRHEIPIKRMVKRYYDFIFEDWEEFQFNDVKFVDTQRSIHDYTYPQNRKMREKPRVCPNCAAEVETGLYCGYCGYDLKSSK